MNRRQAAREARANRRNMGAAAPEWAPRRTPADAGTVLASMLPETVHLFFPFR